MVEIPQAAAAAVDDLLLLDLPADGPNRRRKPRADQAPDSLLLDDLLGPSLDAALGLSTPRTKGEAVEEEDLEWLTNKDSFPSLESSAIGIPIKAATLAISAISATSTSSASNLPLAAPPCNAPKKSRSKICRKRKQIFAAAVWSERERKRCSHCETEKTPQWRIGPEGPKTLCNACGVRYRKGKLVPEYRPVNSPTFSAELHSNSHRRIVGMRKRMMDNSQAVHTGRRGRPPRRVILM